jgi:hypothetical protein
MVDVFQTFRWVPVSPNRNRNVELLAQFCYKLRTWLILFSSLTTSAT